MVINGNGNGNNRCTRIIYIISYYRGSWGGYEDMSYKDLRHYCC